MCHRRLIQCLQLKQYAYNGCSFVLSYIKVLKLDIIKRISAS